MCICLDTYVQYVSVSAAILKVSQSCLSAKYNGRYLYLLFTLLCIYERMWYIMIHTSISTQRVDRVVPLGGVPVKMPVKQLNWRN